MAIKSKVVFMLSMAGLIAQCMGEENVFDKQRHAVLYAQSSMHKANSNTVQSYERWYKNPLLIVKEHPWRSLFILTGGLGLCYWIYNNIDWTVIFGKNNHNQKEVKEGLERLKKDRKIQDLSLNSIELKESLGLNAELIDFEKRNKSKEEEKNGCKKSNKKQGEFFDSMCIIDQHGQQYEIKMKNSKKLLIKDLYLRLRQMQYEAMIEYDKVNENSDTKHQDLLFVEYLLIVDSRNKIQYKDMRKECIKEQIIAHVYEGDKPQDKEKETVVPKLKEITHNVITKHGFVTIEKLKNAIIGKDEKDFEFKKVVEYHDNSKQEVIYKENFYNDGKSFIKSVFILGQDDTAYEIKLEKEGVTARSLKEEIIKNENMHSLLLKHVLLVPKIESENIDVLAELLQIKLHAKDGRLKDDDFLENDEESYRLIPNQFSLSEDYVKSYEIFKACKLLYESKCKDKNKKLLELLSKYNKNIPDACVIAIYLGELELVDEVFKMNFVTNPGYQVLTTYERGYTVAVAFRPGNEYVVSSSDNYQVNMVNIIKNTSNNQMHHTSIMHKNLCWSVDGRYLASDNGKIIRIWDCINEKNIKEIDNLCGHTSFITSVDWSSDGRYLLSGSQDKTIILWDCSDKENIEIITKLEAHDDWINTIAWCSYDGYFISASDDKTIKIWDCKDKRKIILIKKMSYEQPIKVLSLSNDGDYVSFFVGKTIYIGKFTDSMDIEIESIYNAENTFVADFLIWSPMDNYLAYGLENEIKILDCRNKTDIVLFTTLKGHKASVTCADWSSNGKFLVTGGIDKTVILWHMMQERKKEKKH